MVWPSKLCPELLLHHLVHDIIPNHIHHHPLRSHLPMHYLILVLLHSSSQIIVTCVNNYSSLRWKI